MLPGLGKAVGEAQTTALHEVLANQKKDFKVTLLLPVENSVWGGLWDWVIPKSEAASRAGGRQLPSYDRREGKGQKPLFIPRDPEVGGPEETEKPSESLSDYSLLPHNPITGLSFMFLLRAFIPPWKPSLFWTYLCPECTTAGGSPVTNFSVSGALELGT